MKNFRKHGILRLVSYMVAVLFLLTACLFFHEFFLHAGRNSFFTFQADFLSGFMPWNTHHNMYPGEKHGLGNLLAAFLAQFYRKWGVEAGVLFFCLPLSALLTLVCRKLFRFARKPAVLFFLPLFWAMVFFFLTWSLAARQVPEYLGFKYHSIDQTLRKTQRLVSVNLFATDGSEAGDSYREALKTANAYWDRHPCPINDLVSGQNTLYNGLSEKEILFRMDLAAYTRLALLGTHRLDDGFFTYCRVPEIYNYISDNGSRDSYRCETLGGQLTGNHTLAYSQAMNVMESEGLSYSMLEKSIFSALVCFQYGLANKYIRLLKGTLFYRAEALVYEEAAQTLQHSSAEPIRKETALLLEKIQNEREKAPKDYIHDGSEEGRTRELWRQSPRSLANLERIALMDLLHKNLDSVVSYIPVYLKLSRQHPPYRLPDTWQETLYILSVEKPAALEDVRPYLDHLAWNGPLVKECELFYQAKERLFKGFMSPQQITQSFGHLFIYNYYFSRFVNSPGSGAEKPLAH